MCLPTSKYALMVHARMITHVAGMQCWMPIPFQGTTRLLRWRKGYQKGGEWVTRYWYMQEGKRSLIWEINKWKSVFSLVFASVHLTHVLGWDSDCCDDICWMPGGEVCRHGRSKRTNRLLEGLGQRQLSGLHSSMWKLCLHRRCGLEARPKQHCLQKSGVSVPKPSLCRRTVLRNLGLAKAMAKRWCNQRPR